jgi:hypothetical protein
VSVARRTVKTRLDFVVWSEFLCCDLLSLFVRDFICLLFILTSLFADSLMIP